MPTLTRLKMEGADNTACDLLAYAMHRFTDAGIESARLEAELLLEHITSVPRLRRHIGMAPPIAAAQAETFLNGVERRARRIPLQHIVGFTEFLGLRFRVTPDVLIPRPETEQLVLRARERLPARADVRVADLGTGSGCIALTLAASRPGIRVDAFDLSPAALELAKDNAALNRLTDRVAWHESDVFRLGAQLVSGVEYDLIVTNPPYIPSDEVPKLMPEVRDHDPRLALDGGPDGLEPYRNLARCAHDWLAEDGWLLAEFGDGQAAELLRIFGERGWHEISVEKDLSGRDRILIVRASRHRNPAT